jgi:membrane-bound lytic murein transglycosylase B
MFRTLFTTTAAICTFMAAPTLAAQCGNTANGFEAWKGAFAQEARAAGVGQRGLDALASARYANGTIAADRNQKSFKYSLSKFMQVRGADTIVAQSAQRRAL